MMKRFVTPKEASDYLCISEEELNELAAKRVIPIYKIGGIYSRFKVDDLEAYRREGITKGAKNYRNNNIDRLKDFFYFNDFYIYSTLAIIVIFYFILKKS